MGEWCDGRFYYGIKTGLNEAFVINGVTRAKLIGTDKTGNVEKIIKPFLRGRDVKRWQVESADKWLIKIPSSENAKHPWTGLPDAKAEAVFKIEYKAIYDWWIKEDLIDRLIRIRANEDSFAVIVEQSCENGQSFGLSGSRWSPQPRDFVGERNANESLLFLIEFIALLFG